MQPFADLIFGSQTSPVASLALDTQIILVRHGRSTLNDQGRYQGSSDAAVLTDLGWQTAQQVGYFLKAYRIHTVYSSPLQRVRQTTEAILTNMASKPRWETHPHLREINMHHWEGQSFQQVQSAFAADYQCWKQRPHEFQLDVLSAQPSDATATTTITKTRCFPVIELYERAQQFWREILPRHLGQTVLIVSHGGTNRALISTAIGLSPAHFHGLQQSNCGISCLSLPTGSLKSAQIGMLNLTTPIQETLPKLKEGKTGLRLLLLPAEASDSLRVLTERLKTVSIDFSLTSVSEAAQSITAQILASHPQTVQLQTQHSHFLVNWQQTIAAKYQQTNHQASQLLTGLVVAERADMQQILGQAVGLSPEQTWRIYLQPGTLSILHYPAAHQPPVLQALNFA